MSLWYDGQGLDLKVVEIERVSLSPVLRRGVGSKGPTSTFLKEVSILMAKYYASGGTTTANFTVNASNWTEAIRQADRDEEVQRQEEKPMKKRRTGYEVGSRVLVSKNPRDHDGLAGRMAVVIYCTFPALSLEFDEPIPGGHRGPDQRGAEGCCWNIDAAYVKPVLEDVVHVIAKDFEIGGKNVKGAEVRVLGQFSDRKNSFTVVEFKENVGGHSGDGLGKRGHCWSVPAGTLKMEKKKSKKKDK